MKLLTTLNDDDVVVVDSETGTVLSTNLSAVPWPASKEEQELLLSDADFAHHYAKGHGYALVTLTDEDIDIASDAQRAYTQANIAREDGDTAMERDYLRDTVDELSRLLYGTELDLVEEDE